MTHSPDYLAGYNAAIADAVKVAQPIPYLGNATGNSDYEKHAYDLRCTITKAISALTVPSGMVGQPQELSKLLGKF